MSSNNSDIFKQCPSCEVYTEKIKGCNLITCLICKNKWCWICGLSKPKNDRKISINDKVCVDKSHRNMKV